MWNQQEQDSCIPQPWKSICQTQLIAKKYKPNTNSKLPSNLIITHCYNTPYKFSFKQNTSDNLKQLLGKKKHGANSGNSHSGSWATKIINYFHGISCCTLMTMPSRTEINLPYITEINMFNIHFVAYVKCIFVNTANSNEWSCCKAICFPWRLNSFLSTGYDRVYYCYVAYPHTASFSWKLLVW